MVATRWRAMLVALVAAGFGGGCRPPPLPPGYISTEPGAARQFDLGALAGVGTQNADPTTALGGAGLQVEPYATSRLSVPIDVGAFGANRNAAFASRLGLRYRLGGHVSVGGGLGPTMWLGVTEGVLVADPVAAALDFEAAYGRRWNRFGLSAVARPTVVVVGKGVPAIYGQFAFAPSFFVRPRVALTGHLFGGPAYDIEMFATVGGGVGLFVHL